MTASKHSASGRDDARFTEIRDASHFGQVDLARKHKIRRSDRAALVDQDLLEEQQQHLRRDGYVIIEDLVTEQQLNTLRQEAGDHLSHLGRNSFEGERTQRIYGLPSKLRSADPFIEHPLIVAHLERLMLPNFLLSQAQVINILDGSPAQPMHMDDSFYPFPRPRPPLSIATVFAIDDFTVDNGATVAYPGSHQWEADKSPGPDDAMIKAVMPAGSCILFLGTLWHGGGENYSGRSRMALTAQYCEAYLRTQENYFLTVDAKTVAGLSEDMQRMLGYSIHPPFIGMSNGMHPKRVLEESVG
ncbi:MAG: phytanoyl-CoA dioxygenase family protein [Pseudomonadota bacterium]